MGQAKKRAVEIDGWWLDPIPPELRKQAVEEAESGDAIGFLIKASNVYSLDLVFWNEEKLRQLGLFEEALLDALISPALNSYHCPLSFLRSRLARADRKRLREAGDVLPSDGPFTLYRGVAGHGRARRVCGISWTGSLETAQWFANRSAGFGLPKPAVYSAVVCADDVLTYSDQRNEQEFIVLLPETIRPKRILDSAALSTRADEITAWHATRQREAMERIKKEGVA
jgi:cell division inhibitor SulA